MKAAALVKEHAARRAHYGLAVEDGRLMAKARRAVQVMDELAQRRIDQLERFIAQRASREAQQEDNDSGT